MQILFQFIMKLLKELDRNYVQLITLKMDHLHYLRIRIFAI